MLNNSQLDLSTTIHNLSDLVYLTSQQNDTSENKRKSVPPAPVSKSLSQLPQWRLQVNAETVARRQLLSQLKSKYSTPIYQENSAGFTTSTSKLKEEKKKLEQKYTIKKLAPYKPTGKYDSAVAATSPPKESTSPPFRLFTSPSSTSTSTNSRASNANSSRVRRQYEESVRNRNKKIAERNKKLILQQKEEEKRILEDIIKDNKKLVVLEDEPANQQHQDEGFDTSLDHEYDPMITPHSSRQSARDKENNQNEVEEPPQQPVVPLNNTRSQSASKSKLNVELTSTLRPKSAPKRTSSYSEKEPKVEPAVAPLTKSVSHKRIDKQAEKRKQVLKEIISTERDYVSHLDGLFEHYVEPLKTNKIISEEAHRKIFSDLEIIRKVNSEFLNDLRPLEQILLEKGIDSDLEHDIIKTIIKHTPSFKLYVNYISHYDQIIETVSDLSETMRDFKSFRDQTTKHLKVNLKSRHIDMLSFMVTPIQRLPRYKLLLEELVKSAPESHPFYSVMCRARDLITQVAEYFNTKRGEATTVFQVAKLANELNIKDLVQPSRKFIQEGSFKRVKKPKLLLRSDESKCKFYLFNDLLVITQVGKLFGTKHHKLPFKTATGEQAIFAEAQDGDLRFRVRAPSSKFDSSFLCASKQVRDSWVSLLQQTVRRRVDSPL